MNPDELYAKIWRFIEAPRAATNPDQVPDAERALFRPSYPDDPQRVVRRDREAQARPSGAAFRARGSGVQG